jgi:hypothetical protein
MPRLDRWASVVLAAALVAGSAGCAGRSWKREPFTTAQIVQMSKENVPPEEIIRKIHDSRTVYMLTSIDVKNLLDQGVNPRVVDAMMETRVREARSYYDSYYYPPYYGPYFGFTYGVP